MSLSQQDEEVLATLAAALRAEDPELADALAMLRTPHATPVPAPARVTAPAPVPVPVPARNPVPARDLVDLSATFIVLIVATTLRAAGLAVAATAALVCILTVPWLALSARAAERSDRPPSGAAVIGRPLLAAALILASALTLPLLGQVVVAGVAIFVALPWFVLRLLAVVERGTVQPEH